MTTKGKHWCQQEQETFWPVPLCICDGFCSASSPSVAAVSAGFGLLSGLSPSSSGWTVVGGVSAPSSSKTESGESGNVKQQSVFMKPFQVSSELETGQDKPLDGVTCPSFTWPLSPPFTAGVSDAWSWSVAGNGGVELVVVRSGVLAAGDGELWGSGVGVRSDLGEPDLRPPGTGDGFCWGSRRRSFSCSWASKACAGGRRRSHKNAASNK